MDRGAIRAIMAPKIVAARWLEAHGSARTRHASRCTRWALEAVERELNEQLNQEDAEGGRGQESGVIQLSFEGITTRRAA